MRTESQNKQIFTALKHGAVITPQDALQMCGCFRLSARIADLKEIGCIIENDSKPGTFARYRLSGFAPTSSEEKVEARLSRGGGRA